MAISSNCVIGNVLVPEHHPSVIIMTQVMTITENPTKPSDWMNNPPSAKLTPTSHEKRREYVRQVLDFHNNPILQKNSRIAGQIIDLIMIFWSVFIEKEIAAEPTLLNIRSIPLRDFRLFG